MATNTPLPTFTNAGLSVPAAPDILSGILADWQAAFATSGRALNTELTTPQGQIAQTQAFLLQALNAKMLQMIANVDPDTSSGAFQDALARIYFLVRQPATHATVTAQVGGMAGETLPAGAQVRSADGSLWASQDAAVFSPSGVATVTFQAAVAGAGPVAGVNGLTIYQQLPGWETVSNSSASVPGVDVESRQSFETRRADSVSIGGNGTAESVRAAVANVAGVSDVFVYNNGSDNAINYGATSYPIPAHSIAIVVAGGSSSAIAAAIHSKLDAGCGLPTSAGTGTLITQTIDDRVNYVAPYPQYLLRFVRPAVVAVYWRVEVANLSSLPSNYAALVQQALVDAVTNGFSTADRGIVVSRGRLGGQIVAAAYAAVIQDIGNIAPISIFVGTTPNPLSGRSITMGIDQLPVTEKTLVTVVAVSV